MTEQWRGGRQCLQRQVSVRETDSTRDREAAKQAQCSTAVQTKAAASGCGRTDGAAGRGTAQTTPLGAQSSQTAPGASLAHLGSPWGEIHCPSSSVAAGDRLGAEARRGTMTRVSGDAAAIKTWPCSRTSCCRRHPLRRKVNAHPSQEEHLCPAPAYPKHRNWRVSPFPSCS